MCVTGTVVARLWVEGVTVEHFFLIVFHMVF